MKRNHIILYSLLLFTIIAPRWAFAQNRTTKKNAEKEESVRGLVKSGEYVFKARTVLPMHGGARYLTSDYDLVISRDTVQAYLPYFGRAYISPVDPSKGGIQFTSTQFKYNLTNLKKGGWKVMIKPEDDRDVQQLILTISTDGYALLQVISTHRQPISFNGKISEK